MGRLDDIIDRNKHPRKHRKFPIPLGIMLSAFVLLILILMIFTDLAISPAPKQTARPDTGEKRVRGVLLAPPRPRGDAAAGSATP